jgi:hypothetical protein
VTARRAGNGSRQISIAMIEVAKHQSPLFFGHQNTRAFLGPRQPCTKEESQLAQPPLTATPFWRFDTTPRHDQIKDFWLRYIHLNKVALFTRCTNPLPRSSNCTFALS